MPNSLEIISHGGPEVLKLVSKPSQALKHQDVKIAVSACGVNFADIMMRVGLYPEAPKLPFVPGYEVAGKIIALGSDVKNFQLGDSVLAGCKFGGYTTEIVLPSFQVRKIPKNLTEIEAASIIVNFITAWVALCEMARVRSGDRVLIQSAAGGVGIAATQIAALEGAQVIGLVGSIEKKDTVCEFGAHEVWINEHWESALDTEVGKFDIILDCTGGNSLKRSFRRLTPGGRVISYGFSKLIGGHKRSIIHGITELLKTPLFMPLQLMKQNKGIFGLNMLNFFDETQGFFSPMRKSLDKVLDKFEQGKLRTKIGKTFPLAHGGEAHAYLQSRKNVGKIILLN
ncbi:zinc-binding dehydrogenase [Candidatus Nomurabacteria bacterium]|nr:zinc-binding dehydrogenase [Candidatus Nomurabacteria bacterium]